MFKELGSLMNLMKNAQEITARMQDMRERLADRKVSGSSGGGMVTVEMNGQSQVLSCKIDPSIILAGDQEMLEDLIVSAANQALEKVKLAAAEEMGQATEGFNIPGFSEALSKFGPGGPTG